ncbi:cytochrome c [Frigidibacter oleivorans]|uniref:cytochrome c n=1 Tax=Frigidibacter oleivorans TaxID=2487129 RepID=UPI000F8DA0E5|nr:cytochrome c [Frigidibacter oleivorans]
MMTFLRILTALVLIGIVALLAFIFVPPQVTGPQTALTADWQPEEGAGEYTMRLADCEACHTAEGGTPFAGGRPIESPLGTIYSTNITPDPETGIGDYTLDQFRNVLYDGLREDGAHLYPAMPYANYRRLSEEDVRALYHFFMEELEPVSAPDHENEMPFPFNQRWGIRAWKWVGLGEGNLSSEDRGAYLVEGPGHCGACHTPRNAVMAERGYTADDPAFLTGGEIAGWTAPPLHGPASALRGWSDEDMKLFFASGRNDHVGVNGEMALVVRDSTQYFRDEDLDAMVAYLKGLGQPAPATAAAADAGGTQAVLEAADPGMALGPRLYLDNCNACHFTNGRGADQVFPELDGSSLVTAASPVGLIETILWGAELPSTEARPYSLRMPGFADRLSDEEVAELATFLRDGWSNDAGPVTADAVAERRQDDTREPSQQPQPAQR